MYAFVKKYFQSNYTGELQYHYNLVSRPIIWKNGQCTTDFGVMYAALYILYM